MRVQQIKHYTRPISLRGHLTNTIIKVVIYTADVYVRLFICTHLCLFPDESNGFFLYFW